LWSWFLTFSARQHPHPPSRRPDFPEWMSPAGGRLLHLVFTLSRKKMKKGDIFFLHLFAASQTIDINQ
jgi:hypothetical protein